MLVQYRLAGASLARDFLLIWCPPLEELEEPEELLTVQYSTIIIL